MALGEAQIESSPDDAIAAFERAAKLIPNVTGADVVSGAQKTYVLSGAGHTHDVTLSAADFAQLQANQGLVLQTDPDGTGHSHAVTISCA